LTPVPAPDFGFMHNSVSGSAPAPPKFVDSGRSPIRFRDHLQQGSPTFLRLRTTSATSLICTPAIKIKMLLNLPSIILVGLYWSSLMWRHWPCYCHFQNRLTGNLHGPCGRPGARGCIFTKCNRVRKSSSFQVNLNLKPNPNPYCNLMLTPKPNPWT